MKKLIFFSLLGFLSCNKNAQTHPPVGGILSQKDLDVSKERTKKLNSVERQQIQEWIAGQPEKFYAMPLNYWVNKENFSKNPKKEDGEIISYMYDIYDFDMKKVYDQSIQYSHARLGKLEELKAVEDALRYISPGEEVTLLVPSSLAYGTYGDEDKIDNDVPLIIKLKSF